MSDPALAGLIRERIEESVSAKRQLLADEHTSTAAELAELLVGALRRGAKLLLFGNGGSAADAQHLAAEFLGRFGRERASLPAIALSDNSSSLTAIGNDYAYSEVFARQVEGLGAEGDVAIALSTSGRSENVLEAVRRARARGIVTIGLTGAAGAPLKEAADACLCVPSTDTARIQEGYMLIGHILCEIVERELFGAR